MDNEPRIEDLQTFLLNLERTRYTIMTQMIDLQGCVDDRVVAESFGTNAYFAQLELRRLRGEYDEVTKRVDETVSELKHFTKD